MTATAALRDALAGEWQGGALVLDGLAVERDRVRLTFAARAGGPPRGELELVHPSAAPAGAVKAGPFAVRIVSGASPELAEAVAERVRGLEAARIWSTPEAQPEPDAGATSPPPQPDDADEAARVALAIRNALHAARTEDEAVARAALVAVQASATGNAGPDIAETWYRIGDGERGKAVARAWLAATPDEQSVRAVRAQVLAGGGGDPEALAEAILALPADQRCEGAAVAETMARVGQREPAHALLRRLAERLPACSSVAALEVAWLLEAVRMDEADARSAEALARFPDAEEMVGLRAQVLLARERPEEAVALLEPMAWRNPDSGLVSSLQGAYMNVKTPGWLANKRAELVRRHEADPSDYTAAFLAGVIMHYEGRLEESNALLEPLVPILGKQPRLYIYLGMNAFDLGDADTGLAWIQKAFDLEAPDPDVYYCRAEILHYRDPAGALADLEKYLALTEGSPTVPEKKHARVAEMARTLRECVANGGPVPCPGPWEHPRPAGTPLGHAPPASPWPWVAAGLGLLAAAIAAWALRGRLRRG
ncbi:MAG: hypothetical protein H6744_08960 [Deltaproteobacteria bacterium]|nr:hypothetical protein [Deltaproteobacteria bacterium]